MTLSHEEKKVLLALAREAIAISLRGEEPPEHRVTHAALREEGRGAFVSLHRKGVLRGCIGALMSPPPLYETISNMAVAAATADPRFEDVTSTELEKIDIEISVLTPLRKVIDVQEIEVGRHGIYLLKGDHKGVLLPQVATEYGWKREQFLDHTCIKAGLKPGEWSDEGVEIYIFEAEIFKEGEADA